jgi:hypothetical protein
LIKSFAFVKKIEIGSDLRKTIGHTYQNNLARIVELMAAGTDDFRLDEKADAFENQKMKESYRLMLLAEKSRWHDMLTIMSSLKPHIQNVTLNDIVGTK